MQHGEGLAAFICGQSDIEGDKRCDRGPYGGVSVLPERVPPVKGGCRRGRAEAETAGGAFGKRDRLSQKAEEVSEYQSDDGRRYQLLFGNVPAARYNGIIFS